MFNRLQMLLPFGFLPTFLQWLALALISTVIIGLFKALYRRELRSVSQRTAILLLFLRAMIVMVLVLVAAANPVAHRVVRVPQSNRLLVAIDLSNSMRVTDPQRPVVEKLRLARTIGLHETVAASERISEWIAHLERGENPRFRSTDEMDSFKELLQRCDRVTRLQLIELALASDGGALLDKLKPTGAIELLGFGQEGWDLPMDGQALRDAMTVVSSKTAYTDFKLPLARRGAAAIVVFSDGRHNFGDSPFALGKSLGDKNIPVYIVRVPPREPESDVAIASVKPAVTTICRGSTVPVSVAVSATRWPKGRIDVQLAIPGAVPLFQSIQHDGTDRVHEVVFHPKLDRLGRQTLAVELRPDRLDPRPENNSLSAQVNVIDYKPRVLLIDGEARWELRYLRSALMRSQEPELDVKSVVLQQPRVGGTPDTDAERAGLPLLKLPDGDKPFADFDCVILGDVSVEQFSFKDRERLEKHVSDSGGSLIVSAGKRENPLGISESDPLARLLPIRRSREFAPIDGFRPTFTSAGAKTWFLRLGDSEEANRTIWGNLPAHEWSAVGEAKDGAEGLAFAKDSKDIVIARQQYGFGRVLYLGVDSTWRWRFKNGDELHNRFWKQVIQWAVADRMLPVSNAAGSIRFGPREPFCEAGKPVEVLIRAGEPIPPLSANAVAAVKLIRLQDGKEEVLGIVSFEANPSRPKELTAKLRELPPGRYAIEAEIAEWSEHFRPANGGPRKLRATFEVTPLESNEMADLSANTPLIEELARSSGGRAFELSQIDELADLLASRTVDKELDISMPLQRSWWTLGFIAAFLALEWFIRKRSGLA